MLFIYKGNLNLESEHINSIVQKYIHLVPIEYIEKQKERDNNKYHITLLYNYNGENYSTINEEIYPIGLGFNNDVYYILVQYPSADTFNSTFH